MSKYILIDFPEVQQYMEESWFNSEAILHIDRSGSYFIPENRIIDNDYIEEEITRLHYLYKRDNDEVCCLLCGL